MGPANLQSRWNKNDEYDKWKSQINYGISSTWKGKTPNPQRQDWNPWLVALNRTIRENHPWYYTSQNPLSQNLEP